MRFDDFLKALESAGWSATRDAQHEKIKELWRNLWPVLAELEQELYEERYNEGIW
jgi:hypothetical protein